ncbi:MAG TPA: hypothetical protein VM890_16500 [Longimicrobium sp.]|nr:hypothetical protein [Longimicrobium sp.]
MRAMRLAVLALVAACVTAPPPAATAALDQDFRLARGEAAAVGPDRLTVRFAAVVEDSRCPMGVMCIRAGEAKVQLALRAPGAGEDDVIVATEGGQPRYASFAGYDVRLVALDPPRRNDVPHPAYVATLRVSRH